MERSYTVLEVDALKVAHKQKYLWGHYGGDQTPRNFDKAGYCAYITPPYNEFSVLKAVEDATRTSMIAGHVAADLLDSEKLEGI